MALTTAKQANQQEEKMVKHYQDVALWVNFANHTMLVTLKEWNGNLFQICRTLDLSLSLSTAFLNRFRLFNFSICHCIKVFIFCVFYHVGYLQQAYYRALLVILTGIWSSKGRRLVQVPGWSKETLICT